MAIHTEDEKKMLYKQIGATSGGVEAAAWTHFCLIGSLFCLTEHWNRLVKVGSNGLRKEVTSLLKSTHLLLLTNHLTHIIVHKKYMLSEVYYLLVRNHFAFSMQLSVSPMDIFPR